MPLSTSHVTDFAVLVTILVPTQTVYLIPSSKSSTPDSRGIGPGADYLIVSFRVIGNWSGPILRRNRASTTFRQSCLFAQSLTYAASLER